MAAQRKIKSMFTIYSLTNAYRYVIIIIEIKKGGNRNEKQGSNV